MIGQIKKRYGSVVKFDKSKITNAIYNAAREGGNESKAECDKVADKVVEKIAIEMPKGAIPTVEGIQDLVEQALIETGHAKTAKAYIIYRQKRAEIRNEKKHILEKDEIDEVDKKFDVNALRVLKARYLRKDDSGKLIEAPKQLFTRVAVHTSLPDMFYDNRVYDKEGKQAAHPHEEFEPAMYDGELAIGRHVLNKYHLEAVKRMFDRFDRQGNMKVSWSMFLEMLEKGEFNSHEATIDEFFDVMVNKQFMPNTPAIANFGSVLGLGSACFVLGIDDDLSSIMDTLKHTALIHQSGGGCIAGDARVWTTFCGIEPIEVVFNRATSDGRAGIRHENSIAYDVRDLDIRTASMNPSTGETALRKVTHVWKFDVPAESQIIVRTREGAKIQTSNWHPFMVLRGAEFRETPADKLQEGDIVLGPENAKSYWPWKSEQTVGGMKIGTELGWLAGFTLGDGSFGYVPALRQQRLRWFSGTRDVLDNVCNILKKHDINVSIQRDPRGGCLSVATLTQDFVAAMRRICALERNGPKDAIIRVPEHIGKSPLEVVRAFIAGLMDSDGNVDADGSPSYTTASKEMAYDLAALISMLGCRPTVRRKEAHGKGKLPTYTVLLCTLPQVNDFASEIAPYMANESRKQRLQSKSTRQTALTVDFNAWRNVLKQNNMIGKKGAAGPCADELNYWSAHGKIDRASMERIALALKRYDKPRALLLRRIAQSGHEVSIISRAEHPKAYYDFTVDEWNTYAAGKGSMLMIHNTGFNFSKLRPEGDIVKSTCGAASGPISFMSLYDNMTDVIKQGGMRRGANMGIMNSNHPDIEKFITAKEGNKALRNFNISVLIMGDFWDYYEKDEPYPLINPRNGQIWKTVSPRMLFDKLVYQAWESAEPGVIFFDRMNDFNPFLEHLGPIVTTNPCGEVQLYPNEPCNLGSVNVWAFVKEDDEGNAFVDWDDMARVTKTAAHFLDNVIDVNKWPLQQIEDIALATRKIGLGVMGVGDLLFDIGLPYNEDEGRLFMEKLMQFVNYWSKIGSIELAKERGPLPFLDKSFYPQGRLPFHGSTQVEKWQFEWAALGEEVKRSGIRNGFTTVIAPTGSISMIAGCSSGIEPVYSLVFEKNVKVGSFYYIDPVFEKVMKREGLYDEDLMKQIAENRGSIQNVPYMPASLKRIFVTAMDVTPESHIRALAAFQNWVDSSISKTNNFPANATIEDMRQSYLLAYQLGCKGVTVFRDSSIKEQVLVAPKAEKVQEVKKERYVMADAQRTYVPSPTFNETGEKLTETATGTILQHVSNMPVSKKDYKECPTCSSKALSFKEGCLTCESCGWGLCA